MNDTLHHTPFGLFLAKRWGVAALLIAVCAGPALAQPASTSESEWLVFDMPYGGCRLVVAKDGSASVFYGALPHSLPVPSGTFDFKELAASLRKLARDDIDKGRMAAPIGSVRFGLGGAGHWFNDEPFAKRLFRRALENRVPNIRSSEPDGERIVAEACSASLTKVEFLLEADIAH